MRGEWLYLFCRQRVGSSFFFYAIDCGKGPKWERKSSAGAFRILSKHSYNSLSIVIIAYNYCLSKSILTDYPQPKFQIECVKPPAYFLPPQAYRAL